MENKNESNKSQIEQLLYGALNNIEYDEIFQLREKYEDRINQLGISSFQAEKNLGIEYKTLNRLLDGDIKKFDLIPLIKLGYFLSIDEKEISELFTTFLSKQYENELNQAKKTTFILEYFDIPTLKKIGVINSTTNFEHIENRINAIFGLKSILDYDIENVGAAMSSTVSLDKNNLKSKSEKNRNYFKDKSKEIFSLINNPNKYQKEALVNYFSKIRWHSTDFENGLINVIRSLYKLGVTVIFQEMVPSLKMRGATFEVNKKPCIVLTDFRKSYPTLWFAFIHELFHVLFDWEEILLKTYHLSDEENDLYVIKHKEEEANEFAREYLFSKNKIETISNKIKHNYYIKEFAIEHHVHPSIIYANYAHYYNNEENRLWAKFDKLIRPPMDNLIKKLNGNLSHCSTANDYSNYYLTKIYNSDDQK